jgi:hypothetical protein
MRKSLLVLLVATGCLLGLLPSPAPAAGLSDLLGARAQLGQSSTVAAQDHATRPQLGRNALKSGDDFRSLNAQRRATIRFPILRRLIRFYILWVVKPLDIWPVFPDIWD